MLFERESLMKNVPIFTHKFKLSDDVINVLFNRHYIFHKFHPVGLRISLTAQQFWKIS